MNKFFVIFSKFFLLFSIASGFIFSFGTFVFSPTLAWLRGNIFYMDFYNKGVLVLIASLVMGAWCALVFWAEGRINNRF